MKLPALLPLMIAAASLAHADTHHPHFHHADGWLKLPEGQEHLGDSHGEIDVDSEGRVYVSVSGGERAGIQVFAADGRYLSNVRNARNNHHGFTIRQEDGKDVIYAACLGDETAYLKLALDGEILMEVPTSRLPADPEGKPKFALTDIDVAPNGDVYLVDGYSSDRIFVFDSKGEFKKTLAGKGEPTKFNNAHKFAIDPRYEPARLLVCDRNNQRLVHLSLDGEVIGDVATQLRRPSAVDFHEDLIVVAEISGRVSVLNKEGKIIAELGANPHDKEVNTNKTKPEQWREGVTTSPHGICFDKDGNVLMCEWNNWGRVLRWNIHKD